MLFNFKYDESTKRPKMKLCYMNKKVIGYMNELFELKISPTFLDISPMTFAMKSDNKHFSIIKKHLLIHVDGMGYFVVKQVSHKNDGLDDEISIECESYESTLNDIAVSYENTTYWLYNTLKPNESLLIMVANACGWTIDYVDPDIAEKRRTFDNLDNIPIYNLLMTSMSDAYKCYFVFDTENKTISAYDREKVANKTNIAFTFSNLLENVEIKESSDDIISVMHVSGADGVYISNVNPIGDSCLYDFTYFMNHDYGMSGDLIAALTVWNTKVENAKLNYEILVLTRQTTSADLVTKQSELAVLQAEYKSIQDARSALNLTDADVSTRLTELYDQEQTVNIEITAKQTEINTLQNTYDTTVTSLATINESLAFDNTDNFTTVEREELRYFEKSGTYTNENFVYTSITTESDKIDISNELLSEATKTFQKLSQPCYEFSMDISNYLYLPEFKKFTDDTNLGVLMNVEIKPHTWVQPKLLKIELDYDDIKNTKFTCSDTLRLQDDIQVFEDIYNAVTKSSNKVAITAGSWDEPKKNGFYNTVKSYMSESLSLAQQEIMNSANQQLMIGSYGMICRKYYDETDTYDPHELRLNNNVLCFSADGFKNVTTALGRIKFGDNIYYGLNTQLLVGEMIVGNELTIATENNTLTVDADGTTLENANFSVFNSNNRVLLSPTDGIKIQKILGVDSYEDKLYLNTDGNIVAKGITLEESNIAGWTTTSTAFTSPTGDYIGSNGYGKLSLMSWTPTSATFDGNIYATNLKSNDTVSGQNIFVDGTMGGDWLTNSSVGYGKLSDLCVNSLRAGLVTTNELEANYVTTNYLTSNYTTTNNLSANYATISNLNSATARIQTIESDYITSNIISTDYLLSNDGVFRGKILVGSENNSSLIESSIVNIDNITARQLSLESTNGIKLQGHENGIVIDSGVNSSGTENPTIINKLTVMGDSQFNGHITGDTTFDGTMYINGATAIVKDGYLYDGQTQDVTVGTTTLHYINGILVGVS